MIQSADPLSAHSSDLAAPGFKVYPNPSTGAVWLQLDQALNAESSIYVINTAGQVLHESALAGGAAPAIAQSGTTASWPVLCADPVEQWCEHAKIDVAGEVRIPSKVWRFYSSVLVFWFLQQIRGHWPLQFRRHLF